jgi:hypothetical protein
LSSIRTAKRNSCKLASCSVSETWLRHGQQENVDLDSAPGFHIRLDNGNAFRLGRSCQENREYKVATGIFLFHFPLDWNTRGAIIGTQPVSGNEVGAQLVTFLRFCSRSASNLTVEA